MLKIAGIAQLVEHDLAKVGVASSSLVSRSRLAGQVILAAHQLRRVGRVAMQRIANPCTSVRLRDAPPVTPCPGGEIGRHKGFKIPRL